MSFRGINTTVIQIRRQVFTEVARMAYANVKGEQANHLMRKIPYTIIPGEVQLTSVDHGACEKGKEAVDILLEQTKSERKRIVHMEYEPRLIIRLSTFNRKKSSSQ